MTDLPDSLSDIDWSLTTFEGVRREQMRRWAELTLEEIVVAQEGMAELIEILSPPSPDTGSEAAPSADRPEGRPPEA